MSYLVCKNVTDGLRPSECVVEINDWQGRRVFLRVERDFLTRANGKSWLPVGKLQEDKGKELALVELPQEAESGVNRLWVKLSDLLESNRVPA